MLKEEQVAALLEHCEALTRTHLGQVRGNLSRPENRSAAIWELLTLDACSVLGEIEYEVNPGGSPDIRLTLPSGTKIWIEVAFLYPRFWKEERQSEDVCLWIDEEARRRGLPAHKFSCHFYGAPSSAGFIRNLPAQHERTQFLKSDAIKDFFKQVAVAPSEPSKLAHQAYSLSITYSPTAISGGGGGLVQEAPKNYKEHALYRTIKLKARQHDVPGIRFLCIGSDQSNALSRMVAPDRVRVEQAVGYAFSETTSISGLIAVNIENMWQGVSGISKHASGALYTNENCKSPISEKDKSELMKLDFNRWKYQTSLNKYKTPAGGLARKAAGPLSMTHTKNGGKLEIPTAVLLEILAGRTTLAEAYGGLEDDYLSKLLSGDYRIKSCGFEEGNLVAGEGSRVSFELEADFDAIFERCSKK